MKKIFLFDFDETLVTEDILDIVCDIVGKKEEPIKINEDVINVKICNRTKRWLWKICRLCYRRYDRYNNLFRLNYIRIKNINENKYKLVNNVNVFYLKGG